MKLFKDQRPRVEKLPAAFPGVTQKQVQASAVSNWTLSYRLRGLAFGLILAGIYCYFIRHEWSVIVILAAGVLGWFLGWLAGRFLYTK